MMCKYILIFLFPCYFLFTQDYYTTQYLSKYKSLKITTYPFQQIVKVSTPLKVLSLEVGKTYYIFNQNACYSKIKMQFRNNTFLIPKSILHQHFSKELKYIKKIKNVPKKKYIVTNKKPKKKIIIPKKKIKKYSSANQSAGMNSKRINLDFIIIDPGHGGKDPGAFGINKRREKDLTLKVSKIVFKQLKKRFPNTKIVLTRSKDRFISLEKRSEIANKYQRKNNFGIFISLHYNADFSYKTNGFEIYYLDQNSQNKDERRTIVKKNIKRFKTAHIKKWASYLMNSRIQQESSLLANIVQKNFKKKLNGLVSSKKKRKADFSVLRRVAMPAVLLELGYITNPKEARVVSSTVYQKKIANALINSIKQYVKKVNNIL